MRRGRSPSYPVMTTLIKAGLRDALRTLFGSCGCPRNPHLAGAALADLESAAASRANRTRSLARRNASSWRCFPLRRDLRTNGVRRLGASPNHGHACAAFCSRCKRSRFRRGAGVKEPETDPIADSVSPDRAHLKAHKDRRLPCDCRVAYGVAYAQHTARPAMASPMSSWALKTGASWGSPVASACWRQDCEHRDGRLDQLVRAKLCRCMWQCARSLTAVACFDV